MYIIFIFVALILTGCRSHKTFTTDAECVNRTTKQFDYDVTRTVAVFSCPDLSMAGIDSAGRPVRAAAYGLKKRPVAGPSSPTAVITVRDVGRLVSHQEDSVANKTEEHGRPDNLSTPASDLKTAAVVVFLALAFALAVRSAKAR